MIEMEEYLTDLERLEYFELLEKRSIIGDLMSNLRMDLCKIETGLQELWETAKIRKEDPTEFKKFISRGL